MAGKGPPPKPADQRARGKRSDIIPFRLITQDEQVEQPLLPADVDWHVQTIAWWHKLRDDVLSNDYTVMDWTYLLDTAFVHNAFWHGSLDRAGELRLRMANFGATPADRARLRIQVITADEAAAKADARKNAPGSRKKYEPPKAG